MLDHHLLPSPSRSPRSVSVRSLGFSLQRAWIGSLWFLAWSYSTCVESFNPLSSTGRGSSCFGLSSPIPGKLVNSDRIAWRDKRRRFGASWFSQRQWSLSATVYSWLDDDSTPQQKSGMLISHEDDGDDVDDGSDATKEGKTSQRMMDFMTYLSEESMAALARLAVAFSPPERALSLRQVREVHVLAIDDTHVDLEAVVCDPMECVTLSIPVVFPHPCHHHVTAKSDSDIESHDDDEEQEECIMGNIDELDVTARQILQKLEWQEQHADEIQEGRRQRRELLVVDGADGHAIAWPAWWVHPYHHQQQHSLTRSSTGSLENMQEECDQIKSLLNEDEFQTDIRAVLEQALALTSVSVNDSDNFFAPASAPSVSSENSDFKVDHAAVVAVGPAGLVLRGIRVDAKSVRPYEGDEDDYGDSALLAEHKANSASYSLSRGELVEVPIRFRQSAADISGLRAAVLGAVSAASM